MSEKLGITPEAYDLIVKQHERVTRERDIAIEALERIVKLYELVYDSGGDEQDAVDMGVRAKEALARIREAES